MKAGDKFPTAVKDRKVTATRQRANPPPAFKKVNFCAVQLDARAAATPCLRRSNYFCFFFAARTVRRST